MILKPFAMMTAGACMTLAVSVAHAQQVSPTPQAAPHDHREHVAAAADTADQDRERPTPTDAERAAAFPHLHAVPHMVHDYAINSFVLFDQFEWQQRGASEGVSWDAKGWVGQDVDRLWFRAEGAAAGGGVDDVRAHLLYGRAIARWWDVVAGVRQDWRPGPAQTWAAVGLQGLAPYFFEVEATAYVGAGGRTHLRLETSYDLLFTNRLILQPSLEAEVVGKGDPERLVGVGLSTGEAGLRLRYEFRRELAPYLGVVWSRRFFGTAQLAASRGHATSSTAVTIGGRVWF